jgi:hypothetical protein
MVPSSLWALFEDHGLVLLSDPALPAVAQHLAGPISGSWWGHAAGGRIYAAANALEAHPDVLVVRLVSRKVTFVHRRLWPALLRAAVDGGPWQKRGLTADARTLLEALGDTPLRAEAPGVALVGKPGPAMKLLVERLLARGWEEHTPSGAHARRIESWKPWAEREKVVPGDRAALDAAAKRLGPAARLPWEAA